LYLDTASTIQCLLLVNASLSVGLAKDVPVKFPRYRLRTLIIVVAIVSIAVYTDVLRRRRAGFVRRALALAMDEEISRHRQAGTRRSIAQYEERMEDRKDRLRRNIATLRLFVPQKEWIQKEEDYVRSLEKVQALKVSSDMARVSQWSRRCDYFAALLRKYERAARYPWLTVSADPPEPPEPE
jgi:hypothetical protein